MTGTTTSLWELLYTTALQEVGEQARPDTYELYSRAQDAVNQGAFIFPNGTLCVNTVHQLQQLCWNETIDVYDTSFFHWLSGVPLESDPFWTDHSSKDIAVALIHILSSICLIWCLYRYVIHLYILIPLVQWAHRYADDHVLADWTLTQVYRVYGCCSRTQTCYQRCTKPCGRSRPNAEVNGDTENSKGLTNASTDTNSTPIPPPSAIPSMSSTGVPPPSTIQSDVKEQKQEMSKPSSWESTENNQSANHASHTSNDFQEDGTKQTAEFHNEDLEEEEEDDDDTRPVFTITLDYTHPNMDKDAMDQLLKAINEVPPPLSQTALEETGPNGLDSNNHGTQNESSKDADEVMSETNGSTESEEDPFRATFRNPMFPMHWASNLPTVDKVPEVYNGNRKGQGQATGIHGKEMCCYMRPYLSTVNIIGRRQDLDFMWTGAMQPPSPNIRHQTHIPHYPLHKRAVLKYTPHNPIMEKRWYYEQATNYPNGLFEDMLTYHSKFPYLTGRSAEYYVGGHIAILIRAPSTYQTTQSLYTQFLEAQWRREQKQFNGGRLYLTFEPNPQAVENPMELARDLNTQIDQIVERTLEMNAAVVASSSSSYE